MILARWSLVDMRPRDPRYSNGGTSTIFYRTFNNVDMPPFEKGGSFKKKGWPVIKKTHEYGSRSCFKKLAEERLGNTWFHWLPSMHLNRRSIGLRERDRSPSTQLQDLLCTRKNGRHYMTDQKQNKGIGRAPLAPHRGLPPAHRFLLCQDLEAIRGSVENCSLQKWCIYFQK